jgi:hypothetical protein
LWAHRPRQLGGISDSVDSKLCQGLAKAVAIAMVRQFAVGNQASVVRTEVIIQAPQIETDDGISCSMFGKLRLHDNEANGQANGDYDRGCILLTAFTGELLPGHITIFTIEDLACLFLI